ncbi:MAG: hypothetical protein ACYCSN_02440 [Acidobacteriaceae bacterium]
MLSLFVAPAVFAILARASIFIRQSAERTRVFGSPVWSWRMAIN